MQPIITKLIDQFLPDAFESIFQSELSMRLINFATVIDSISQMATIITEINQRVFKSTSISNTI